MKKLISVMLAICIILSSFTMLYAGAAPAVPKEPVLTGGELVPGIPANYINSMAIDRDKVLWLGFNFKGIMACYNNKYQIFDKLNTNMPDNTITKVFVDKDNVKWFGTSEGNVYTYDNKKLTVLQSPKQDYPVKGIVQDREGTVWVSGYDYVWSYKNNKLDRQLQKSISAMTTDKDGRLLVLIGSDGIYRLNGDKWERIFEDIPKEISSRLRDMSLDRQRGTLYIATVDDRLYAYNAGSVKELKADGVQFDFAARSRLYLDSKNTLWIISDGNSQLYSYDGSRLKSWKPGVLAQDDYICEIAADEKGMPWIATENNGLKYYDGKSLISYPAMLTDARTFWKQKDISELYRQPLVNADINDVLKNPIQYRGKKLRIIGKIKSSFEYAEIFSKDGKGLGLWPDYHYDLWDSLEAMGMDKAVESSEYKEFIGYLDCEGGYGHMGVWAYQFEIVEMYPYPISDKQKTDYKAKYNTYLGQLEMEKTKIRQLVAQWLEAEKSNPASIAGLAHSQSAVYSRIRSVSANDMKKYTMDITIKDMRIMLMDKEEATIIINDAAIKLTGAYYKSNPGEMKIHSLDLKKEKGQWKIYQIDKEFTPQNAK